jgi:hypothetical protein
LVICYLDEIILLGKTISVASIIVPNVRGITLTDKRKGQKKEKVKAFQELDERISNKDEVKKMQPMPQPKDFEEIEY